MANENTNVQIMIPVPLAISKKMSGVQNNPHFKDDAATIALNLINRGWETQNGDGYIHAQRPINKKFKSGEIPSRNTTSYQDEPDMTVSELVYTMSEYNYDDGQGGLIYPEVYNFNPYIKVAESDIDNEIPEGLPNRIGVSYDYTDPDNPVEIQVVRTWRTWRKENQLLYQPIEGYYYFKSNTYYNYLTGTELMIIYDSVDATLVDDEPVIE